MPRQNTSPAEFPPAILLQIEQLAQRIVTERKQRGETQAQWATRLGISQPTMARVERGDPAVTMATYISCLWQLNPELDLTRLLPHAPAAQESAKSIAAAADSKRAGAQKTLKPKSLPQAKADLDMEHQQQIERNFAAAKAALDFFKSPLL